jgi:hypothetical protein
MQYRLSVQGRMLLTELEPSTRTESKRITNHNTPQISRMGLPVHCATFPGLSRLNTRAVFGKSCAIPGPVCTLEICQWYGEPCFAGAAILKRWLPVATRYIHCRRNLYIKSLGNNGTRDHVTVCGYVCDLSSFHVSEISL